MAKSGWGIVGVVALCVSCGTSGPSDMGGMDAGASGGNASGGAPGSGGSGASGGSGGNGSGAASSGGALGTGGQGSGGQGAVLPSDLFPIALGNRWTYVLLDDPTGYCDQTYLTEEVYQTTELGGVPAFVVSAPCFAPDVNYDARLTTVESEVLQWLDETWKATLATPVAEGATWTLQVGGSALSYGWYPEPEVTVPAGTFQNCWSRRLSPPEASTDIDTYCPGVGPVRRISPYLTLELSSYSIE